MAHQRPPKSQRFYTSWVWFIPLGLIVAFVTVLTALSWVVNSPGDWPWACLLPVGALVATVASLVLRRRTYIETSEAGIRLHTSLYTLQAAWKDVWGVGRTTIAYWPNDVLVLRRGDYTVGLLGGARLDSIERQRFPDIERAIPLQPFAIFGWRRSAIGSALRRHLPTLTAGGWVEPDCTFNESVYDAYAAEAVKQFRARQRRLQSQCGSWLMKRWSFDGARNLLRWGDAGPTHLETSVVYVGNFAERLGLWQWAWGHLSVAASARDRAAVLKDLAARTTMRILEDPDPFVIQDDRIAWELAAVCTQHLDAIGCVRVLTSSRGTYAYFVITEAQLKAASSAGERPAPFAPGSVS